MHKTRNFFLTVIGLIWAFIVLSPFYLVVVNSSKKAVDITLNPFALPDGLGQFAENLSNVIGNPNFSFYSSLTWSALVTVVTLTLLILLSSMAAWVLCRNKTWWSSMLFMMFIATMIIPFQAVMLPLLTVFRTIQEITGIQMLQSFWGLIFAYMGFGAPLTIFVLHGFIKNIPFELEQSASIDGCSPAGTFFRIIFPLLRPVQVTLLILNGIWIWNDFLLPLIMLGLSGRVKTLPVAVQSLYGTYIRQWDLILTAAFLAMIPAVTLFIFAQKYIIKGMVEGAIKG